MNINFRKGGGSFKARIAALAISVAITGAAVVPMVASADQTSDLIASLQAQILLLQAQLNALGTGSPSSAGNCGFTRSLKTGMRGDDVKCLQNYLTSTGHFTYSGGATGYFGAVTRSAVSAWQGANGVAPAAGYFGSISQTKYNSLVAMTPPPPPPTPGCPPNCTTPPPTPVGSGLTVSSPASQPVSATIPEGSARVPYVKATFTASSDGDVTVKSVTVERKGLLNDAAFSGIILLDEDGTQIGNTKTLSSEHKVMLNEWFTVKAGTSKTITIAGNMAASLDDYNGQLGRLAITAVDAGTSLVNASLPMEGNAMSMNSTLSIGSVTMAIGSLDPGAANTKNVGTEGYYFSSVKASAGSAEDVTFEQLRWNQAGSVGASDLANVVVNAGGTNYPTVVSSDGKYYISTFPGGLKVTKGNTLEFSIKGDIVNGSGRTVDFDVLRASDIVVRGNTYGFYILSTGGSSGAASAGAFSSNQEPFFNAYAATVSKGSLLVSSSNQANSTNITLDTSDQVIGGFLFDVKGEPIQISSFALGFNFTGTGTSTAITSVKVYDEAGNIVAGPKDPTSSTAASVTWTDTWTAPVGQHHFLIKAKLSSTATGAFVANDTIVTEFIPGDTLTAKGQTTGLSITATPSTRVSSNSQTIKGASLAISVSTVPTGQNIVRGVNGYLFATYVFDANGSGEDVRVTSVQLRDTVSATTVGDEVNSCVLWDGANALNAGSDVQNPSDPSTTSSDMTFSLTNNLIVPKGTVKKIDLKCNISSNATANSTHSWGTNAGSANVNSVGALNAQTITESITTSTGQVMTIKTAGSYTVVKDASSPVASMLISGKTDSSMAIWKFHATDEDVDVKDVTLTYSTTTASTSDFAKATLWDGATMIGTAVWAGNSTFATSTLSTDYNTNTDGTKYGFRVPKDGDRLLTIKMDTTAIGVVSSSTAGRLMSINYDGNSSTSATGRSSGVKLGSLSVTSFAGDTMQLMKTVPTLEKVAVPNSSIPQADAVLYRFKVKADASGPVALYKFTFQVSSSTGGATTTNFRLFGYSDSSFSTAAYQNNPISFNNVDCVGRSNFTSVSGTLSTTCGTSANSSATRDVYASSTQSATDGDQNEVVFFFAPSANVASTSEAIQVPAGEWRYFSLVGDITLVTAGNTGNSIQVQLNGDAARPVARANFASGDTWDTNGGTQLGPQNCQNTGRGARLCTAAEVSMQSANNDFVWSPMSTSTTLTGATTTVDWTNGFLIPGLPSTNMGANTFTN